MKWPLPKLRRSTGCRTDQSHRSWIASPSNSGSLPSNKLLAGVQEQALAEALRARQEVVLALVEQPPDVGGLVDVVAVALPDFPEGLHADGQLASSHGHGSWSPAYIVVSAGCAPWRVGRGPGEQIAARRSATVGRGGASAPRVNPCPGSLPSAHEAPVVLPRSGGLKVAPRRARRSPLGVAPPSTGAPSRFRAPSSGAVRRSRSPWYCIVQTHLVRRLVARLTGPERRHPQHTARLAHVRLTGRRRPLPVEQPAMPSAPKWTRRNRHLRLRHGSARCRIMAVQARLVEPAARPTAGPPRWPAGP